MNKKRVEIFSTILVLFSLVFPSAILAQSAVLPDQSGEVAQGVKVFLPLVSNKKQPPLTQADCDTIPGVPHKLSGWFWPKDTSIEKLWKVIYRMKEVDMAVNKKFFPSGKIEIDGLVSGVCLPEHYYTSNFEAANSAITWKIDRPDWAGFFQPQSEIQATAMLTNTFAIVDHWLATTVFGSTVGEISIMGVPTWNVIEVPQTNPAGALIVFGAVGLSLLYDYMNAPESIKPIAVQLSKDAVMVKKTAFPTDDTMVRMRCFSSADDPQAKFKALKVGEAYAMILNGSDLATAGACIIASNSIDLGGRLGAKNHSFEASLIAAFQMTAQKKTSEEALASIVAQAEEKLRLERLENPEEDPKRPFIPDIEEEECPILQFDSYDLEAFVMEANLVIIHLLETLPPDEAHIVQRNRLIQFHDEMDREFSDYDNVVDFGDRYNEWRPRYGLFLFSAMLSTQVNGIMVPFKIHWQLRYKCTWMVVTDDLGVEFAGYSWFHDYGWGFIGIGMDNSHSVLPPPFTYEYWDIAP